MKSLILSSLSILALSTAIAPTAQAQIAAAPQAAEMLGMAITPFNLVFLAYQGFLESNGIPKFGSLVSASQNGRVRAEHLVQVAIKTQRLAPETIHDRAYLVAVQRQLDGLALTDN